MDRLHHVLEVREDVSIRLVAVPRHKVAVDGDVELAVATGNERKRLDVLPCPVQRLWQYSISIFSLSSAIVCLLAVQYVAMFTRLTKALLICQALIDW